MTGRVLAVAAVGLAMALAAPLSAKCAVGKIADLKVTMNGMRPMVTVGIEGQDATFLLDTGAFHSSISPGSAATLGLKPQAMGGARMYGIGGTQDMKVARVKAFTIAGATVPNVEFVVGGSEHGSVGLLGLNVLALADSEYDLAHGAVRLFKSNDCADTVLAYWAKDDAISVVEMEKMNPDDRHFVVPVYVNGVRLRAILDTGASKSMLSKAAAARAGMTPTSAEMEPSGVAAGLGRGTVQSWIAPFDSFRIGGEEIRRTRLRIGDFSDLGFDMLIGADFFLAHRLYVAPGLRRVYFTHNGGPVFRLGDPAAAPIPAKADASDPGDADGFAQRGRVRAARGDLAGGLADLDQAVTRAPDDIAYRRDRAGMLAATGRLKDARADYDRIVARRPDDGDARVARAALRLRIDPADKSGARDDLAAAAARLPDASDLRLALADLYVALDDLPQAIAQTDLWIRYHPDDRRRGEALNGRCWARALSGRDLDRALDDCNAALRFTPGEASYFDSRGLVRLRSGDPKRAVADYDSALAKEPKMAWSLYGRGIAKIRLGQRVAGEADLAAARAIEPGIADRARRYGIAP
jgi:predicted aspartyl protease/tetratricopeptide (TPR) repeat protein